MSNLGAEGHCGRFQNNESLEAIQELSEREKNVAAVDVESGGQGKLDHCQQDVGPFGRSAPPWRQK